MKDFEAIKAVWKVQQEAPVNYDSIMEHIHNVQKKHAQKLILQTLGVLIALLCIVGVWLFKPFFTWTTHLSLFLLSGCLTYFLILQLRDYKWLSHVDRHLLKPDDFIEQLKAYKKASALLNKNNYKLYALGIGFAFLLLSFELYFILPLWLLLFLTISAVTWFIISYRYLLKEYIYAENSRLESMIAQLENLKKQLKD